MELVLQDEVERGDQKNLPLRLRGGADREGFDRNAPVSFDRERLKDFSSLGFLAREEDGTGDGDLRLPRLHALLGEGCTRAPLGRGALVAGNFVVEPRGDPTLLPGFAHGTEKWGGCD